MGAGGADSPLVAAAQGVRGGREVSPSSHQGPPIAPKCPGPFWSPREAWFEGDTVGFVTQGRVSG